jgi:hypothetical protein
MWHRHLPDSVKKTATRLIANGHLSWADLLEDGNLFWEIAFCEKTIWPEPDRWHATICNFLLMLAWERSVEGRTGRLFPSARFQIVRDLYFAEWQERSQRLGELLYPLYFPPPPSPASAAAAAAAAAAAHDGGAGGQGAGAQQPPPPNGSSSSSSSDAAAGAGLSAYERQRAEQMLRNQAKLVELGLVKLLTKMPASKAAKRARPAAAPAAPSRASGRQVHGIEEDTHRCLWVGCGKHFRDPSACRAHEGVHTGTFPFNCPACGKGHANDAHARACCAVGAACRCGAVFKGSQAKRDFARHQKKCQMGAAPLPASAAAAKLN